MDDELKSVLQEKLNHYTPDYIENRYKKLKSLKTVDDVEKARCNTCSSSGHWGWCDQACIVCGYKYRIKQILGIPINEHSVSFEDDLKRILTEGEA